VAAPIGEVSEDAVSTVAEETGVFGLTPFQVATFSGVIIPVLTAAITKINASDRVKQVVTILLAAVATLVAQATLDSGSAVFTVETLQTWFLTTVVAVASYLGFWKRTVQVNAHVAPNSGIGGGHPAV
jgi:chromate transport protein ChrA